MLDTAWEWAERDCALTFACRAKVPQLVGDDRFVLMNRDRAGHSRHRLRPT
jgi:hypothetical protein